MGNQLKDLGGAAFVAAVLAGAHGSLVYGGLAFGFGFMFMRAMTGIACLERIADRLDSAEDVD